MQNGEDQPKAEQAVTTEPKNEVAAPELRTAFLQFSRALLAAARRPYGRLTTMGLVLVLVIALTGIAGANLVPAVGASFPMSSPDVKQEASSPPIDPEPTDTGLPPASPSASPSLSAPPAEQFAAWAANIAPKVEIPVVAMQAYGYAEWVLSQTRPSCKLQWTTLAAIGKVESDHGRAKGATLDDNARALPAIIGPALDGTKGTTAIADTDGGALDKDKTWDHAVGPMQFIPRTWLSYAVDADGDQVADPHDLDDAALAAAYYLCDSGKDLSVVADWKAVVLRYNNVGAYLQKVYDTAQLYGVKSKA